MSLRHPVRTLCMCVWCVWCVHSDVASTSSCSGLSDASLVYETATLEYLSVLRCDFLLYCNATMYRDVRVAMC